MSGTATVARAVLRRTMIHTYKNPAIIVPSLAFPLIFLVAFAGGLSAVSGVPGFDFAAGYTAFQFIFVFLQMAETLCRGTLPHRPALSMSSRLKGTGQDDATRTQFRSSRPASPEA